MNISNIEIGQWYYIPVGDGNTCVGEVIAIEPDNEHGRIVIRWPLGFTTCTIQSNIVAAAPRPWCPSDLSPITNIYSNMLICTLVTIVLTRWILRLIDNR